MYSKFFIYGLEKGLTKSADSLVDKSTAGMKAAISAGKRAVDSTPKKATSNIIDMPIAPPKPMGPPKLPKI